MKSRTSVTAPKAAESEFVSSRCGRPAPPNVVFILADDLGARDLGCYGSEHIATPRLDQMAQDGLRFTDAYAGSPWCSPTRISLYTGRDPGRLEAGLEEPLRTRSDQMGIPAGHPTLPSLLAEAGYATAMFGKWHCGWLPWFSPLRIGFETFFGNLDGAVDYFEHIDTLGQPDLYEGETPVEQVGYYTELISARAVDYIQTPRDRPFYLQVNYTAPHWPWEGPQDAEVGREILRQYQEGDVAAPIFHFSGGSLAKYAELVEALDAGVGEILTAIERSEQAHNTLVVFCSDNGGERWSQNWPYIGEKGDITEGGIRVPQILRWPAVVEGGQIDRHSNITMDWTATILDAAGATPHPDYPLDGLSLLPWLADGAAYPDHDLFWRVASQGALRRGRFKYLRDRRDRAFVGNWPRHYGEYDLLYDVTVDGREAAEISRLHPEAVAELKAEWERRDAELLPYPPDHPNLPRRAAGGRVAVSQPD